MVVPGRPSACWTCKLRHVSCDKGAPACSECVVRSITCHGYGKLSPWANDRRSEQREKQAIKQAVKNHVRQQMFHRNNNKSQADQGSTAPTQRPLPVESPSLSAPSSPGRARGEGRFPQPSDSHDALSYSECSLLMHYFDQVFPIQYPGYTSNADAGRGWMLWLLQKNSALAKAALGLASLHRRYTSGKEDVSNVELEYLARVLRDLQDSISRWNVPHSDMPHGVLVEIIACSANLVSFEVRIAFTFARIYQSARKNQLTLRLRSYVGAQTDGSLMSAPLPLCWLPQSHVGEVVGSNLRYLLYLMKDYEWLSDSTSRWFFGWTQYRVCRQDSHQY